MADFQSPSALAELSTNVEAPLVSIGMPVYNGAEYIQEALDSLLEQSFTDFELIISDNASTDTTQSICEQYAQRDSRIRYVRQDMNQGALANFHFVLSQANGSLFMWAAHDDLWAPGYLLAAIELLKDPNYDFVFPTFELRSVRLGIAKKFDPEIFRFIESADKRQRVLNYMALHFLSLGVNIVYSLFRTDFIKSALVKQDISNEGALGAILLSYGRGARNSALFSKRYRKVFPGMVPSVAIILNGWLHNRDVVREARQAIQAAKLRMLELFPEYEREISFIFARYRPYSHDRLYRVCSIDDLL